MVYIYKYFISGIGRMKLYVVSDHICDGAVDDDCISHIYSILLRATQLIVIK